MITVQQERNASTFPLCRVRRLARHRHGLKDVAQLFARGALSIDHLERPAVGVVGARATNEAAMKFARALGEELARRGQIVVSGGALGIDGAAHAGALDAEGTTVAVLGTGVDIAYPEKHQPLFERVAEAGLLLSPFPTGTTARAWQFPLRNQLIAGLSDAVVVIEAGSRSGSLGTASAARRLGIPLYCRPGSPGCDALIAKRHAKPVFDAAELAARLSGERVVETTVRLAPGAQRLFDALVNEGAATADQLAARLDAPLGEVLEHLLSLEISRRAVRLDDRRYLAFSGSEDTKG